VRWAPRSLGARLLLAAALALAVIAALEWSLRARDARAALRANAAARGSGAPAAEPIAQAGFTVAALSLATPGHEPADAQIVWQLLPGGRVVVRRAAPPPTAPGLRRLAEATVVLPSKHLAALDPEQRAGLLDLLSSVFAERPVAAERLRLRGVEAEAGDVAALLRWLR
jgi:hypothetical protein